MNSRERVVAAIEFTVPDKLPIMHSYLPGAATRYGQQLQDLFHQYPSDFNFDDQIPNEIPARYKKGAKVTDEWGCVWENVYGGIEGQITHHPLADLHELESYSFPAPPVLDPETLNKAIDRVGHTRYFHGSGHRFFEQIHFVRGFENVLMDLVTGEPELETIANEVFNYCRQLIESYCQTTVDGISFSDDWGSQNQLLISPKIWREFFKPYYKEMFEIVKNAGKHVHFHSDGCIVEIIEDLIEVGVDVLNPQINANGLSNLEKLTRGRICLRGGLDRQVVLPLGKPEEVTVHARAAVDALSTDKGGYIGSGEIGPDVPIENARAMYEAFSTYRY